MRYTAPRVYRSVQPQLRAYALQDAPGRLSRTVRSPRAQGVPMPTTTAERTDLLETLNAHRRFLRQTAHGLTDAQAAATPTVSALSIGGIIKHVSATEAAWVEFICHGPHAFSTSGDAETRAAEFEMRDGTPSLRSSTGTRPSPTAPISSCSTSRTSTPVTRSPQPPGSHPERPVPHDAHCSTSLPKPPNMRAMPTSSAKPLMARRPWDRDTPCQDRVNILEGFSRNVGSCRGLSRRRPVDESRVGVE